MNKNLNNKGGGYNNNVTSKKQTSNNVEKDQKKKETKQKTNVTQNRKEQELELNNIVPHLNGKKLKVFVADFDEDLVQQLTHLQEKKPALSIVGAANDGELAKDLITNVDPDVIYLSKDLDLIDGVELTKQIKNEIGDIPIVISTFDETMDIREAGKVSHQLLIRRFSEA